MARRESDREDLMREATALKRRVELALPDQSETVIAGFRAGGFLSIYLGADPVYHFDAEGRLRRAFVDGGLFRTQGATLARLIRVRTPSAVELQRHDLSTAERHQFLANMTGRIAGLYQSMIDGTARVVQQVPADKPVVPDLTGALNRILQTGPSLAPAIKGKH